MAEQPGQTLNVDLCFVPAEHPAVQKLPAVSGSSGRLRISPLPSETAKLSSPGMIFADASLDYTEAMLQFVAASPDAQGHAPSVAQSTASAERAQRTAQRKAWRHEADVLRVARHAQRVRRTAEDRAWQALRKQIRELDTTAPAPSRTAALKRQRLLRLPRRAHLHKRQRAKTNAGVKAAARCARCCLPYR